MCFTGELGNRCFRENRQVQVGRRRAGKITENELELVIGSHFIITIRYQKQYRCLLQTTPRKLDEVERRLIRPVNILENKRDLMTLYLEQAEEIRKYGGAIGSCIGENLSETVEAQGHVV
jgi:hypothetical protein